MSWEPGLVRDLIRAVMQALVSLVLLSAGLIIVFGKYDDSLKKAAFTWIGAIVGFWLS